MSETRENLPPDPQSIRRGGDVDDQITLTTSRPGAGQVVIEVDGEVDMLTSPQLRATVIDQIGAPNQFGAPSAASATSGVELVVLGLDAVSFLGTSGLAVLIEVREAAHTAGVELRLACTARRVLRPLTIAGLIPLFDIHDTVDQALAAT